jgi:hypothetical protein
LFAPFRRELSDFFPQFFFKFRNFLEFFIPIPTNLPPQEAAVRNPFAYEIFKVSMAEG